MKKLNEKGMEYIPFLIFIGIFLFALLVAASIIAYNGYHLNSKDNYIRVKKTQSVDIQKKYTRIDYEKFENELVELAKRGNYSHLKSGESITIPSNELNIQNKIYKTCHNSYVVVKKVGELITYKAYISCDGYQTEK